MRVYPEGSSERLLAMRDALGEAPVERVRLADLTVSFSPRSGEVDGEWALTLAQVEGGLPPIVVHRSSLAVIDGLHRVRAARLKGRTHIPARFFEGSRHDAMLLAVAMNVVQGRPLSVADRVAAAARIVTERPQWSDRAVAVVAGLSAKKVSELRAGLTGLPRCERRVGLDGRSRPLSTARARELAGELLRADPTASLRTIARQAGISPATVADVRDRLLRGDDPVPPRQRGLTATGRRARGEGEQDGRRRTEETRSAGELFALFDSLRRDPSLRLNEVGRSMLRLLDACALIAGDRRRLISNLPPHCADQLADLMSGYSELWRQLADDLRTDAERRGAGWMSGT
ncbi:ParB N-terminal domain-containing protein [Streptomyces sp. NPDC101209]|uniref:ParB N-terminal domain-containing protein n=1 Tax=Streptomyces sp. NPDC101209 TaxID=3366129 RepID=UPI0038012479